MKEKLLSVAASRWSRQKCFSVSVALYKFIAEKEDA
jgi:hypothetical protein